MYTNTTKNEIEKGYLGQARLFWSFGCDRLGYTDYLPLQRGCGTILWVGLVIVCVGVVDETALFVRGHRRGLGEGRILITVLVPGELNPDRDR